MPINHHIVLASRPSGVLQPEHFRMEACAFPEPGPGEALLEMEWLAMDPYLRGLIAGRHLQPGPAPGERMPGQGIARVTEAPPNASIKPGDRVVLDGGWTRWLARPAAELQPLRWPEDILARTALGILGMPGLTAWVGLNRLARMQAGEVVAVSSASGTVGAAVIQLAKAAGCTTVAITSKAKSEYVQQTLGADQVMLREKDLPQRLQQAGMPRFDVAFDNAGGEVLEAMIGHLALNARVVLCGMISQSQLDQRPPGPNLGPVIAARASLHGLVVYDHFDAMPDFLAEAVPLYREGHLRCEETIVEGLERAPSALCALLAGQTRGRVLVRLAVQRDPS